MTKPLQRWLFGSLILWGVGAELTEAAATVGMVATILGVAIYLWPQRSVVAAKRALREWWPLALFICWALFVPLLAGHPPEGTGVARIADWIALPCAMVAFTSTTSSQRRWLAWSIGGVFALSCVAAGLQYRGWWPKPEAFHWLRWTRTPFDRVYEPLPNSTDRFAGGGLLFHRLKFAHVGGLITIGAAVYGWNRRGIERIAAWAIAVLGVVSILIFAWTRAAGVAVVGALVVAVLASRINWSRMIGAAAVVAVLGSATVFFTPALRQRFALVTDSGSNGDRDQLWAAGIRAVKSAPLTGIGLWRFHPGGFSDAKTADHVRDSGGKAHNQFLTFAAEIGIPGSVLFAALLIWLALGMGGPGAMAGYSLLFFFVVLSCVHDPLFHAPFSIALMLGLGIALELARAGGASATLGHAGFGVDAHSPGDGEQQTR